MTKPPEDDPAIDRELTKLERLIHPEPPPSEPLSRISTSVRRLARYVNTVPDTPETLLPLAEKLASLVDQLPGESHPDGEQRRSRFHDDMAPIEYSANPRGTHPLMGSMNPVAPPIHLRVDGDRMLGEVTFDTLYEGNVGWVHGGFVAAGFDIMVVTAARLSGRTGPTGTLEVRYLQPTLIHQAMRYESWFESREGRKIFVRGKLVRCEDEVVTAEVKGIVIARV